MLSLDVKNAVSQWTEWAAKPEAGRYDIALFKIWIQFERFLGDLFMNYSLGIPSEKGYKPRLKIKFRDEEQFNIFMREESRKYIDHIDKIRKFSKHIFHDNPFSVVLDDADNNQAFEQIIAIRNYVAHESKESREKFKNQCCAGHEGNFMEPNDYLKKIKKGTRKSYYTYYVNMILGLTEIIISGIAL